MDIIDKNTSESDTKPINLLSKKKSKELYKRLATPYLRLAKEIGKIEELKKLEELKTR